MANISARPNFNEFLHLKDLLTRKPELPVSLKSLQQKAYASFKYLASRAPFLNRQFLIRRRRWILALLTVIVFSLVIDDIQFDKQLTIVFSAEALLSIILLPALFLLFEVLVRTIDSETRLVNILETKHALSQQLSAVQEWDELNALILQNLSTFTRPEYACLFIKDANASGFNLAREWKVGDFLKAPTLSPQVEVCTQCALERPNQMNATEQCWLERSSLPEDRKPGYCLPLTFGNEFIGFIYFQLLPGEILTSEQKELFNHIGAEKAAALKNAEQRRLLLEMKMAESAYTERAILSRDLHDTLSQDLGYLHLKLDQFLESSYPEEVACPKAELVKMRDVAGGAYEMVRAMLKTLRATKSPLTHLVCELGRIVECQKNIKFTLVEEGQTKTLPSEVLRQVYFVIKEAMSNIARHSQARNVEVNLCWEKERLAIKIFDDGTGFDSQAVEQGRHFGLDVMRERVESVKGAFDLQTHLGSGTLVAIEVPVGEIDAYKLGPRPA